MARKPRLTPEFAVVDVNQKAARTEDLALFAQIQWTLRPNEEVMTASETSMAPEQVEALTRLIQTNDMRVEYHNLDRLMNDFPGAKPTYIAHAIPEHSIEFGQKGQRNFKFSPPPAAAPVWKKLWDDALPEATNRLDKILDRLAELPWQRSKTGEAVYYLVKKEMSDQDQALADAAAQSDYFKECRIMSFIHPGQYELENRGRGDTDHHLYNYIHKKMENVYKADAAIIARLPWRIQPKRGLIIHQIEIAKALPDPAYATALSEAMARRNIESEDGLFILRSPNTTEKLWDAPDGEIDHGRIECYVEASKGAVARLKETINKLAELPWTYNRDKKRIVVQCDLLRQSGVDPVQDLPEGTLWRDGNQWFLPEVPYLIRPPEHTREAINGFIAMLEKKFADFDIGGAENLPWKKGGFDREWTLDADVLKKKSQAGQIDVYKLAFDINHNGQVFIPNDSDKRFSYLPYNAAIAAAVERQQIDFVQTYQAEIESLPWISGLQDDLRRYNKGLTLYRQDLNETQADLFDRMLDLGLLTGFKREEYEPLTEKLREILKPVHVRENARMIEIVAAMPWQYSHGGIRFYLDADKLSAEQTHVMERLRLRDGNTPNAQYSLSGHREDTGFHGDLTKQTKNALCTAIAKEMIKNALVPILQKSITSLPWRYDSRLKHNEIRLPAKGLSEDQQKELVLAGAHKVLSDYSVHGPNSRYIGTGILQGALYAALVPTAEKNLSADLKKATLFPWKKMGDDSFGVCYSDLTASEQQILKQIPDEYWDRKFFKDSPFTTDRTYVLSKDLGDQRLLEAVRKASTLAGLTGNGPDIRKMAP